LDTVTDSDTQTFTGSMPRTYMGDGFTNNTLPGGTTSFNITKLTLYMVSQAAQTYTDVVARVQFWNTYNAGNTPVFTNPTAGPILIDLGPFTSAANTFYTISVTLVTPVTLIGGSGTAWGFAQNFQSNTGAGLVDDSNLTSLITSNSGDTYASGMILTGADPTFGYYRNASGRTDFNFASSDARSLTGLDYQAVGIIVEGVPNTGPAPTPTATPTATATASATLPLPPRARHLQPQLQLQLQLPRQRRQPRQLHLRL
jgi:hypothetical protein